MKPSPLPKLRADLKQALKATPRDLVELRRGLTHAIRAIERSETQRAARNVQSDP